MGLDQVIGEVRRDGDTRSQNVLANARKEADAILTEARARAAAYEAELRDALREHVLAHFAKLDAKARATHVTALIATAKGVIPSGKVWGAEKDGPALKNQTAYKHAGHQPVAGGVIVESEDGRTRLDLTYETLLDGMWRDVLKAESALFR